MVIALGGVASAEPQTGYTLGGGGGTNVGTPFVEAHAGRRFTRARFFELYLDYSYDRAISEFAFQTVGVGVRTYLTTFGRFELFYQASAAFAVSSGGHGPVMNLSIGERLLGAMLEQGVGVEASLGGGWTCALVVSTGNPVWLRPELAVKYTF